MDRTSKIIKNIKYYKSKYSTWVMLYETIHYIIFIIMLIYLKFILITLL